MVSSIRYRSFKTFDLQSRRPFRILLFFALLITAVVTHPQIVLVVLAYAYLVSPVIGVALNRLRRKPPAAAEG